MTLPVVLALVGLGAGGCDDDPGGATATTTSSGAAREGSSVSAECPGASAIDIAELPAGAVEADLDGNEETDWAWTSNGRAGEDPRLAVLLDTGLTSEATLGADPVIEPEIVSVADVGDDRDSLLVLTGTGAYVELVGVYGFGECDIEPITDPEEPDAGAFTLAAGASVMNGAYYACVPRGGETALLSGSWGTTEAGEKEWSEGLFRRQGLEMVQAGEAVTGVASSEEEIGTDRGEACPEPVPA